MLVLVNLVVRGFRVHYRTVMVVLSACLMDYDVPSVRMVVVYLMSARHIVRWTTAGLTTVAMRMPVARKTPD